MDTHDHGGGENEEERKSKHAIGQAQDACEQRFSSVNLPSERSEAVADVSRSVVLHDTIPMRVIAGHAARSEFRIPNQILPPHDTARLIVRVDSRG